MLPEETGLTSVEAKARLEKFGPNVLPEKPAPSNFIILLSQLKSPLVYILLVAGVVTLVVSRISDSIIIFFAVFINTILGFIQERKASRALHALKELIHPEAKVIRDGTVVKIGVAEVVPGDIVVLSQGDKIPADGRLIKVNRLFVSEAILTGESEPVAKKGKNEVYMGTIVASGKGTMAVEVTAARTQIGKIAESIQTPSEDTPLRKQLTLLSKQLSIIVGGLTVLVFVIGLIFGKDLVEIFTTSVALAVSAIPEGLLVGLTVVLAIGMQRILKNRGLVRNLISAETLGGVTTICVDKTGTLTEGKMKVVEVVGDREEVARQMLVANDLDDPIVIAANEWSKEKVGNHQTLIDNQRRLDSIPFSPKERFFASLNSWDRENNMIFVNGAPEFLLEWSIMTDREKAKIKSEIERLTSEGKRLVGLARKKAVVTKKSLSVDDVKNGLHWVGLLAFSDPVRSGVKKALKNTRKAGIKLLVITGDYPETAVFVMRQLDIHVEKENILLGKELARIGEKELEKRLLREPRISLFARTTPEQKLIIVQALKNNGEVVAMMGDGVNDAPALKKADIGIVVGDATDVAKETADLVLLDSNFATIVQAIEEGRGIFDNIRKIILYLLSDSFEEIIAVVGTLVLGLPLPVTAAQILWINLVSDGFPNLALAIDPKAKGLMQKPPRPTWEPLFSRWMKALVLIISLVGGLIALGLFIYFYKTTGDIALARSVTFMALGVNSLVFVYSVKTLTQPFWEVNPFSNGWLNVAVVAGFGLQFIPFVSEGMREFFGLKLPGAFGFGLVFAAAFFTFIMIEMVKVLVRRRLEWFQH